MSEFQYIPPYQRVVSQPSIRILLLVQLLTFLPFVSYMPNWFVIVFLLVSFWRLRVMRGQLRKPPLWLTVSAIGVGVAAIVASGFSRYSLDSAVALCLLGYLLKSLEVLRRRDGIFQIYLGFFLCGVYLLYRFDPLGALIMLGMLFANLIALQAVTSEMYFHWRYAINQSLIMIVGAIPIMIAGYLFFPRIPPLWSIPNDERGSVTGMSDELEPGSVAELARSNAPAFRVSFDGELPSRNEWYWRGTTLGSFDGRTWRADYATSNFFGWPANAQLPKAVDENGGYDYTVIMENSGQRWLYFLDWPTGVQGDGIRIVPDGRAASARPLNSVFRYRAQSSPVVSWSEQGIIVRSNLELPRNGNEELRVWAREQRNQVNSDMAFIDLILQSIRQESFYYTLRPPLYQGRDSIQDFWFGERRGFCEHYASAMTYILRAAGIPARIVGGYLGGTYVESGNYIQVRQMEAHAWLEAWINGQWVRIDPTAAVAPGRVEINLDDLFSDTQPEDLPVLARFGQIGFVNQLSLLWDSLNYQWQVLVLDYDNDTAMAWFQSGFGKVSPLKMALAFLALMGTVALIIGLSLGIIQIPKRLPEPYRSINRIYKVCGVRQPGETLANYFERIQSKHAHPILIRKVGLEIEQWLYQPGSSRDAKALKRLVKQLG